MSPTRPPATPHRRALQTHFPETWYAKRVFPRPTGFRSDYLIALRLLSRDDDPSVYIKAMRFLRDYTVQIDWSTHDAAQVDLRTTNAFAESDDAARLRLLRPALPTPENSSASINRPMAREGNER